MYNRIRDQRIFFTSIWASELTIEAVVNSINFKGYRYVSRYYVNFVVYTNITLLQRFELNSAKTNVTVKI